jgi:hypothetical protein
VCNQVCSFYVPQSVCHHLLCFKYTWRFFKRKRIKKTTNNFSQSFSLLVNGRGIIWRCHVLYIKENKWKAKSYFKETRRLFVTYYNVIYFVNLSYSAMFWNRLGNKRNYSVWYNYSTCLFNIGKYFYSLRKNKLFNQSVLYIQKKKIHTTSLVLTVLTICLLQVSYKSSCKSSVGFSPMVERYLTAFCHWYFLNWIRTISRILRRNVI